MTMTWPRTIKCVDCTCPISAGEALPGYCVTTALTESAKKVLREATNHYSQNVMAQARAYSARDEVAAEHVERAVRVLAPAHDANGLRVVLDWLKQLGFLIVGIAIVQVGQLVDDVSAGSVTSEGVIRVLTLVAAGAALIVAAVAMDVPAIVNWRAARRLRRQVNASNRDAAEARATSKSRN